MLKLNKIYHSDCFQFLSKIDDASINLSIIDPPYNLRKAEWDTFKNDKVFFGFTFRWIDALIPKLKDEGSLYIFNTPYNCAFILPHLIERGLVFQNWLTWDKRDGLSCARRRYCNGQEAILFFTKSNDHVFNCDDIRLPYESENRIAHAKKKGILKNGKRWFPNPKGKLCGEVWHISSARHKSKLNGKTPKLPHITPKPLDLIERIIRASSKEDDLILDCFVGSGTTAIAAKKLKRNFVCCDADKNYVRLAQTNLNNCKEK